MSNALLSVKGLHVSAGEKKILNGVDLEIRPGELHVILGQNGAGKSTLVSAVMGDPSYEVDEGNIYLDGEDITGEKPDVRARKGIFMSFQNPEEIPGVTVENFLRTAKASITGVKDRVIPFRKELFSKMDALGMDHSYAERYLNVGFSGGEKKKTEILQLLVLNPRLAILDETDSGLDVDAVKAVTQGIAAYRNSENAIIVITHNAKILEGLDITASHVISDGRIVKSGGAELVDEVITNGFANLIGGADNA
ncbi:MAG: Fe-S cluster assembly ATPase SufC [Clostridiales bacterium]|nr:Fe-S cluster assembly ATPase SufC [Clostridiales bacterium]